MFEDELDRPIFDKNKIHRYFELGGIEDKKLFRKLELNVLYNESGIFFKQNCVKFEPTDEVDIMNQFRKHFEPSQQFLHSSTKNQILEACKQYGRENFYKYKEVPKDCICFKNKVIYVGTKDPKEVLGTDSDHINNLVCDMIENYFVTNPINYDYLPSKKHQCPKIDKLFSDWVGNDKKEQLYELIAYCMLPDYPLQNIFLLVGSGSNGKSKYMEILKKIIGTENTTATDIPTLTETNFGVAQLYNKLVCMIGETDGHRLERTSILKRLSGGDLVPAQFKNKQNFVFSNFAKIIISTNVIPQTEDKSDGFYRRFMILDFPNTFEKNVDILADIPDSEYEALANICVAKLKKIIANRKFSNEPSIAEKRKIYEAKSNPLPTFIDRNLDLTGNSDDYIFVYEFRQTYLDWLVKNGYPQNVSAKMISKEMQDREFTTDRVATRVYGDPKTYYAYIGVRWKEEKKEIADKEYSKSEILEILKSQNKISSKYSDDEVISMCKKQGIIYEPKKGVYKYETK